MNQKEQKELVWEAQSISLKKACDQQVQAKLIDNKLSDDDLEQISGGLRTSASNTTSVFEKQKPVNNCWTNTNQK